MKKIISFTNIFVKLFIILLCVFIIKDGSSIINQSGKNINLSKSLDLSEMSEYVAQINIEENSEDLAFVQNITKSTSYDKLIRDYPKPIEFYSNVYQISYDKVLNDLKTNYYMIDIYNIDSSLVNYMEYYIEREPSVSSNEKNPYSGSPEYVEALIRYYSTVVFPDVDTNIALSIGAAESGYYKVKGMLAQNNVFGGMGSNGLISFKNIEYGTLQYVKMLNNSYFKKGLTSIETIGLKYCPKKNDNGTLSASSHWIDLVSGAKKYYEAREKSYTLDEIIEMK